MWTKHIISAFIFILLGIRYTQFIFEKTSKKWQAFNSKCQVIGNMMNLWLNRLKCFIYIGWALFGLTSSLSLKTNLQGAGTSTLFICGRYCVFVCMCLFVGVCVCEESLTAADRCWLVKLPGPFVLLSRGYNKSLFSVRHLFEVSQSIHVLSDYPSLLASLWFGLAPVLQLHSNLSRCTVHGT